MVSSEDLIKYAHRISSSNAVEAPLSWMPGLFTCNSLIQKELPSLNQELHHVNLKLSF